MPATYHRTIAGGLKHRVTIQRLTQIADQLFGQAGQWTDYVDRWARIEPISGFDAVTSDQVVYDVRHRLTMRYVPDMLPGMRIVWGSRVFQIRATWNIEERGRWTMCDCIEQPQPTAAQIPDIITPPPGGDYFFQTDGLRLSLTQDDPTVTQTHDLVAVEIDTQAITLGAPALGDLYQLTATELSTAAITTDAPTLSHIHELTADELSTTAPTLATSDIDQVHSLAAGQITTQTITIDSPAITEDAYNLVATQIFLQAPTLASPDVTQVHQPTADELSTAPITLSTPALTQVHDIDADELTYGVPTLAAPDLSHIHELTAGQISTQAVTVDDAAVTLVEDNDLVADALTTQPPTVGQPVLTELGNYFSKEFADEFG